MPNGGEPIDLKSWSEHHREISDEDFRFLVCHSLSSLRVPLTGIMGYLTMLSEGEFKGEEKKIHLQLLQAVKEVMQSVNDIVSLKVAYDKQAAPGHWESGESDDRRSLLHFEDDQMLSRMYRMRFESDGLQYHTRVSPAPDPVALVKTIKPDLILMSVIMPDMDGFSATSLLKKDPATRNVPLLFLTNLGQKEDIEKGMRLGAIDYLVSANYTPWQVVDRVREVLNLPKLKRDKRRYPPLRNRGSRVPGYRDIPSDETINQRTRH